MLGRLKYFLVKLLIISLLSHTTALVAGTKSLPNDTVTAAEYSSLTVSKAHPPGAIAMGADILIARPLLLAATVIGTGLFIVSLPLSMLGNNVGDANQKLVIAPAKATFLRCLGCGMSDNG